jgi:hypothetical protein
MFPRLRFPRLNPDERRFGAEVPVMRRHYTAEDVAEIVESVASDIEPSEDVFEFHPRLQSTRRKSTERRVGG